MNKRDFIWWEEGYRSWPKDVVHPYEFGTRAHQMWALGRKVAQNYYMNF